jgi:hypothetical protein
MAHRLCSADLAPLLCNARLMASRRSADMGPVLRRRRVPVLAPSLLCVSTFESPAREAALPASAARSPPCKAGSNAPGWWSAGCCGCLRSLLPMLLLALTLWSSAPKPRAAAALLEEGGPLMPRMRGCRTGLVLLPRCVGSAAEAGLPAAGEAACVTLVSLVLGSALATF